LDDLVENEARANLKPKTESQSVPNGNHNSQGAGFVMGNAPWEKAHPDTNSTRDFPSFAGIATSANNAGSDKTNLPSWGSGRR